MMDPEWKQKRVADLRSGKYKQGRGHLMYKKGEERRHCCLGVLCDILGVDWEEFYTDRGVTYYKAGADGDTVLPYKIATQCKLDSVNPKVHGYPHKALSDLNDNNYDFNYIAGVIEKEL